MGTITLTRQPIHLNPKKDNFLMKALKTGELKTPIGTLTPKRLIVGSLVGGAVALGGVAVAGSVAARSAFLAGSRTLGRLLIPKTAKGLLVAGVTVPTAVGVLSSSKKARSVVAKTLNPVEAVRRGQKIGDIIQDPSKAQDILGINKAMSTKEKIIAGAKSAGKVGAVAGGVLAGISGVKKVKSMLEKRKESQAGATAQLPSQIKQLGFTDPQAVGLGGVPVVGRAQVMPSQAPQSKEMPKPITNIIQISVR